MPTPTTPRAQRAAAPVSAQPGARRWLLFVHQLPSDPSNLRVRTWRRLQQLGAIPIKQAVYVLPDTAAAREDFEWLKTEVSAAGGSASVFAAESVDSWSDDALVEEFRKSGQDAYAALAHDVEQVVKRTGRTKTSRGTRAPALPRLLNILRERLTAIDAVDFFGSAGRDRVLGLMQQLEGRTRGGGSTQPSGAKGSGDRTAYRGRIWVTRPRPGVDRMSSAWLIRRFIDRDARFGFAADRESVPEQTVPFDMFGVDFSHQGEGCTFETLCAVFEIKDPAVARIAAIVHDLDLKDARFGAPEAATVAAMIEGLQLSNTDDDALLAHGITLFESLYRSFEHSARAAGPRPLARPPKRGRK
jgi:hypothetical protein